MVISVRKAQDFVLLLPPPPRFYGVISPSSIVCKQSKTRFALQFQDFSLHVFCYFYNPQCCICVFAGAICMCLFIAVLERRLWYGFLRRSWVFLTLLPINLRAFHLESILPLLLLRYIHLKRIYCFLHSLKGNIDTVH
jgi:hypothetical protein